MKSWQLRVEGEHGESDCCARPVLPAGILQQGRFFHEVPCHDFNQYRQEPYVFKCYEDHLDPYRRYCLAGRHGLYSGPGAASGAAF